VATTRTLDRVMAAVGMLHGASLEFEVVDDVLNGGVLCALPALLVYGLLRHSRDTFALAEGYYPLETFFVALALLALARVKSLEALRYEPPGEWGKLLGLDRIPEVKTLREKIDQLCGPSGRVRGWSSTLSREWMERNPESVGTVYIDGHVRVYHGHLTKLPRRYVAREKLCLRGTTDYWVNAMDGQPFFVATQAADPGLCAVLMEQIVPRLLVDLPGQPTAAALAADPFWSRFTLIFDRAGYSPQLFADLKAQRKQTPKHVPMKDLPEADRFTQLRTDKKHFIDTIKLIAYRAETALMQVVREKLSHKDEARAVVRQILDSAVDLRPDKEQKTLTVRLHRLTTAAQDQALQHLCAELSETETVYPGTELRLIYEVIGSNAAPSN